LLEIGPAEYVTHAIQSPVDCASAAPDEAETKSRLAPSDTKIACNFFIVVSLVFQSYQYWQGGWTLWCHRIDDFALPPE
jgi:hypothetical protein